MIEMQREYCLRGPTYSPSKSRKQYLIQHTHTLFIVKRLEPNRKYETANVNSDTLRAVYMEHGENCLFELMHFLASNCVG